jgi:YD repeat-containing protein
MIALAKDRFARWRSLRRGCLCTCHRKTRHPSRTQEGTTVKFEYDKEDALVAIHNEAGAVYRFTLDKVGNVKEETGFDGLLRKFGRVRPSSNESSISRKTRGTRKRVVAWPDDDGR